MEKDRTTKQIIKRCTTSIELCKNAQLNYPLNIKQISLYLFCLEINLQCEKNGAVSVSELKHTFFSNSKCISELKFLRITKRVCDIILYNRKKTRV